MSPLIASSLINKAAFQRFLSLIVNIFAIFKQMCYREECRLSSLHTDLLCGGCLSSWEPRGFNLLPKDEIQMKRDYFVADLLKCD